MKVKFRAWDKNHKEMIYISDFYWFEEEGVHDSDGMGHYTNYELMLSTNECDKNNKEIYDGDIISHIVNGKKLVGKVDYADGSFGVRIVGGGAQFLCFFVDNTCEVIGNVYENPNLLDTIETIGYADQSGLASAT